MGDRDGSLSNSLSTESSTVTPAFTPAASLPTAQVVTSLSAPIPNGSNSVSGGGTPNAFSSTSAPASALSSVGSTLTTPLNSGQQGAFNGTATTSATATSTNDASKSSGLTGGEAAGAAIGSLIGGLLIGLMIGFFLWRYKKKKSIYHEEVRANAEKSSIPKDPNGMGSIAAASSDNTLDQIILQATPNNDIVGMLKRLEVIIEGHVENCYHTQPTDASVPALAQTLASLGLSQGSSGFEPEIVAGWCLQPSSRSVALQHVISHVIFSSIDCRSGSTLTMLPEPVAGFLRTIRPIDQREGNFETMFFALNRWRTLSALLLHPNPNERTPLEPPKSATEHQASALANALDVFLLHFVPPDQASQQKQRDHLKVLIIDAAKLGYALFSHTSDWRFIYKDESRGAMHRGTVVCVGLEKLSHRDGHRLQSPQRAVDPRLRVL